MIVYRIYLIKRPGVYLLATSVEEAFKRDGCLLETGGYCYVYFKLLHSNSYIILGCCHSSQLILISRWSGVSLSVSVSLSLLSLLFYAAMQCLQLVPRATYFSSTHSATPQEGRFLTDTDLLQWVFKRDERLIKEGK